MRLFLIILFCFIWGNTFSQNVVPGFISEETARNIAKSNRHYKESTTEKWKGWSAELDTAAGVWRIENNSLTFHRHGKTTKNHPLDRRIPCKDINGCHTIKTKTISIDARKGKVLSFKKEKRTSGNYE